MPWETDDVKRLIELEAHLRGIDPRLALALAEQESGFDPQARSPKGATGIFQLMPGTARQLKVDPSDVAQNISGGLDYLKQQLDAFGGDPGMAVAAYNAGPGVVKAYGKVPPYKETRGLVSRVLGSLGPSSAEAATPQAQPQAPLVAQAQTQPQASGMSRLQELEAHLARLEGQQATQAAPATSPAPPTATSTPAQDAAYRASRGTQPPPPVSQTSPTPQTPSRPQETPQTPDTSWTPGMRFQALPSITQLEPADRIQKTQLFEKLDPASQTEFLRSEEPATRQTPALERFLALPSIASLPEAEREQARQEFQAMQTTQQEEVIKMEQPGYWQKQPGMTVPGASATESLTAPSTMIPLLMPGAGLKLVPGALKATAPLVYRGARAAAEGLSQTAGWTAGRTAETGAVPSPGEIGTEAALNVAAGGVLEGVGATGQAIRRRSQAGKAIAAADAETTAARQAWQQEVATRQQQYQQAVTGQEQALTQARATPGRYTPETPSWVQYEKFGDAAKDAVVDLTPAKAALAEVRASRGVLPDGTIRPFPQAVESIAANLEKATGETSFKTIREELRRLGPLTKSQDGNVRGAAKQLYGIYADVLEASPLANDLLKNANATFRKEMAVQDVADWLKPGHGIVRIDNQGRETINVGALMTRLEKTVADDSLFRRSFAPDELEALRTDVRQLAGTPSMPRGAMPGAATPEPLPVTPRQALGERPKVLKGLTRSASLDYLGTLLGLPPGAVLATKAVWRSGQQLRYGIARAMLGVESRPQIMEALRKVRGVVGPPLYGTMVNALSDAERKALLRETRAERERKR